MLLKPGLLQQLRKANQAIIPFSRWLAVLLMMLCFTFPTIAVSLAKKQESKVQKIASDQTTPEKLSPTILPTILASKKLSLQYVPLLLLFAKDNPFELLFKLVNIESMIALAHCI